MTYFPLHLEELRKEVKAIDRFQSVFNAAPKRLFGASRFSHVCPLLGYRLRRLRRRRRCRRMEFKLCVIEFKALRGMVPEYVAELCISESLNDRRSKRPASTTAVGRLVESRRLQKYNARRLSVCVAGPAAWNEFPATIRLTPTLESFKS